jgi:hypothetical protein
MALLLALLLSCRCRCRNLAHRWHHQRARMILSTMYYRCMIPSVSVVMKHLTTCITISNFQRDPSLATRVSPCFDALRALMNRFEQRSVGRTINLLAKLQTLKAIPCATHVFSLVINSTEYTLPIKSVTSEIGPFAYGGCLSCRVSRV